MKKIALLVCVLAMFSCSEEEDGEWREINIPAPDISSMCLTEFCPKEGLGVSDVNKTEEFFYENSYLNGYLYTQESSIADIKEVYTHPITVEYGSDRSSVTLTDEMGTQRRYILNDMGYATQCEYTSSDQKRQYTFSYTDGYLTQLNEEILPGEGSSAGVVSRNMTFNYNNGELVSVTSPSLTGETFAGYGELQTNFEAGEEINYYRLPCPLLLDIYPLSFHREAMFAGILGKPTQHLTVASYPVQTSGSYFEKTEYSYRMDNNKPTSLRITTIYGDNGKVSGSVYRTIAITIE